MSANQSARALHFTGAMLLAVCAFGCGDDSEPTDPYTNYQSEIYDGTDNWICHPGGGENVCAADIEASRVFADGTTEKIAFAEPADPPIDCFYVYPTVSSDPTDYSDLEMDAAERFMTTNQAARLRSVCRVFAPAYRQLTVSGLLSQGIGNIDFAPAYTDVEDAFRHYIANVSEGRGFVLVGHSQGSRHLKELIRLEVETRPELAERMVAAYLIGTSVAVPLGETVGGDFASTPACTKSDQVGCVVSYATYRADEPPEAATAIFGGTESADTEALCVNPAKLANGTETLTNYYPADGEGTFGALLAGSPFADDSALATPFYSLPDFVTGTCVERGGYHYLEVTVSSDAMDPRTDDVRGDLTAGWGLHLADMNLPMGDLVDLMAMQSAAWQAR